MQEGLQRLTQTGIEMEAAEQIGAGRYERTPERKTYRNGHRDRVWETRVGEMPLRIPNVCDGSCFPSLLEPRRRSEKALLAVIQHANAEGVSTRRVDDLLQALGLTGIDKSRVSRICKGLGEVLGPYRNRPLEGTYPFVWLDAHYLKVRHSHRVVSQGGEPRIMDRHGPSGQAPGRRALLSAHRPRGQAVMCGMLADNRKAGTPEWRRNPSHVLCAARPQGRLRFPWSSGSVLASTRTRSSGC